MITDRFGWQEIGKGVAALRSSRAFHASALNAAYNSLDYLAQPILMVLFAPLLVRHLGLDQYGTWMLVSAVAGTFGILQLGVGDATTKYVSAYRGQRDFASVIRIIRGTLALSVLLGAATALTVFLAAPVLVGHAFRIEPRNYWAATKAIQVGGLVLLLRSISSVFSNTLRAHEAYGLSSRISVLMKVGIIASAVLLASQNHGVVAIMSLTAGLTGLGMVLLILEVRRLLPGAVFWPSFDGRTWREVSRYGFYSWVQGVSAATFSQADRLLIAALLGTSPLAYYTICVQLAQQVHGLPAAAFDFLFPQVSARHEAGKRKSLKKVYRLAIVANLLFSVSLMLPLILAGRPILSIWMGGSFAEHSHFLLSVLAVSFFLLSLGVAPYFTLLGLGKVRFASLTNVAGGILSLAGAAVLIPLFGLPGAAAGRLLYGAVTSLNYVKVEASL